MCFFQEAVLACRELIENSGVKMESAMFDAIFHNAADSRQDRSSNTCSFGSFMQSRQQCPAHQEDRPMLLLMTLMLQALARPWTVDAQRQ